MRAWPLSLALVLCACPSVPIDKMPPEDFARYLTVVEAQWQGRAEAWVHENPDDADDIARVAVLIDDNLSERITATTFLALLDDAARANDVHPGLMLIVREGVLAYELQMHTRGVDIQPASRWYDVIEAMAAGVRRAVEADGLEDTDGN
ncbi:MAG: hypothetical protein VW405_00205 [Rhodospirillaceae bacterium]